jgi:hypothetical protein
VGNYSARITGAVVINAPAFNVTNSLYVGGSGGSRLNNIVIGGGYGSNTITDAAGSATLRLSSTGFGFHGAFNTITAAAWVHIKNAVSGSPILRLDDTSGVQLFTVLNSGNVLINTTTDAGYKLDVNGTARLGNTYINGTALIGAVASLNSGQVLTIATAGGAGSYMYFDKSVASGGSANIGMGDFGMTIALTAILDIQSTTKGFLQPRMTNAQALAIATPATGLQVYDTTNNKNLLYNGTLWQNVATESWVSAQGYLTSQPWVVSGSDIYYSTGSVGIGTTNPLYKLHVSATAGDIVYIVASTGQSAIIGATGSGTNRMYIGYSPGGENISITSSGVVRLNSITSGNVLIGTTTDAGYKLDIDGTFRATGIVYADSTINQPTNFGNKLLFMNSGNYSKIALADGTNWSLDYHSGITVGDVGYHRFYTGSTSGWVERLRIENNGNVGIGTSTPTDKLHIVDNTNGNKFGRISAGGTDASAAWVAQNDQVDNIVYRVFGSAVTGSQMGISLARSASLLANLGGSGKFLVGTFSSTDFVMGTGNQERIRLVDSTGNFLIGTTTDIGNKLEVSGTINATAYKINNVIGYTGILNIPTNPPGQQNVDIQSGIVVNIF